LHENRSGHADIEAFREAAHGHAHAAFAGARELVMNAVTFVAEDKTNFGNVAEIFGKKLAHGVRRDKLVTTRRQCVECAFAFGIRTNMHPLLGPSRDLTCREKPLASAFDDVQSLNAESIARSQDGCSVVRVVRCVHQNRDGVEALRKDRLEPGTTFIREKRVELANDGLLIEFT